MFALVIINRLYRQWKEARRVSPKSIASNIFLQTVHTTRIGIKKIFKQIWGFCVKKIITIYTLDCVYTHACILAPEKKPSDFHFCLFLCYKQESEREKKFHDFINWSTLISWQNTFCLKKALFCQNLITHTAQVDANIACD